MQKGLHPVLPISVDNLVSKQFDCKTNVLRWRRAEDTRSGMARREITSSWWDSVHPGFVPLAIIIFYVLSMERLIGTFICCPTVPASVEKHSWFHFPGTKDFLMEPHCAAQP